MRFSQSCHQFSVCNELWSPYPIKFTKPKPWSYAGRQDGTAPAICWNVSCKPANANKCQLASQCTLFSCLQEWAKVSIEMSIDPLLKHLKQQLYNNYQIELPTNLSRLLKCTMLNWKTVAQYLARLLPPCHVGWTPSVLTGIWIQAYFFQHGW